METGKGCLPAGNAVLFFAVSRARAFVVYWLPVAVWMAIIFSASGDRQSFSRSSRIIGPIVRWIFPEISEDALGAIIFAVRKGAHLMVYAVLAWLFWRGLRQPVKNDPRPWNWRQAALAVFVVSVYATTDELHQHFVPGRQGSAWDVLLDTAGGVLGVLIVWTVFHFKRRFGAARGKSEVPK
jgi:VanZ family protein